MLESSEWSGLPTAKRSALITLYDDSDVEEHEIKSAMAALLRGWQRSAVKHSNVAPIGKKKT